MTTQALRDAAFPRHGEEPFVILLDIEQEELDEPLHICDAIGVYDEEEDTYKFQVGAISYYCAPISVTFPNVSDEEPRGRISVPNVDRRIGEAIDLITSEAEVTVTAVLESTPTEIVGGPHRMLVLQNVEGNALTVEGDLLRPSLVEEPFPRIWIRPAKFRAAFRAQT